MNTLNIRFNTVTVVISLAVFAFAGCSKSSQPQESSRQNVQQQVDDGVHEVLITANDKMKYNIDSFTVETGETVRIVLKHVGQMPKSAMGHNVVILTADTDPKTFVDKATNYAENGYIPSNANSDIIAHTRLLAGGEEDTITFVAPSSPGKRTFLCSFPAHFQAGMKGNMIVQASSQTQQPPNSDASNS